MLGPNHWNGGDKINFQELANVFGGGFSCGSAAKESACNVGDLGSIPGLGRSPGEGKGYPLQYSGLENSVQSMGSQRVGHDWATFTFTLGGWQAASKAAVFTTIPPILLARISGFHRWWVQKWGLGNFNYPGITSYTYIGLPLWLNW